ncbi:MAG: hypothetical protein JW839_12945 [Candidatus Lokiarchaeota archaeon]|nr:hypothetical protein [Candidatus Lokiarchaeota archaeon]
MHPDPSKRLSYHLELFNLLEKKVQEYKPLSDILKVLASAFDSFNPLKLPPIINMLGRYASHFENRADQHLFYMQLASIFHLNQMSIYPLFKDVPPVVVEGVKARTPLRRYIIEIENKVRTSEAKSAGENAEQENEPGQPSGGEEIKISTTSIVDAQLCDSIREPFDSSAGVVIVPTDFISTYLIFTCSGFLELLNGFSKKITLISPLWVGNDITPAEREVLEILGVPTRWEPFMALVGDAVDTVIIPKSEPEVDVSSLQSAGKYTIVAEDLSPAKQCSGEFFQVVLDTLDIDRESLRIDTLKERIDLSEKIASSLRQFQKLF